MNEWGTKLRHKYCTRFHIRDNSCWVCRVTFWLDWFFRKLTRWCSGYGHVLARLAPISSRNDFIVLPIKLSPAKTVPDFDFGRHSINFQRNYTYTKEQQLKKHQQTNKCRAGVCSNKNNNKHEAWPGIQKVCLSPLEDRRALRRATFIWLWHANVCEPEPGTGYGSACICCCSSDPKWEFNKF